MSLQLRKQEYRGYEIQYFEEGGLMNNTWGCIVFKVGESVSVSTFGQLNSISKAKTFIKNIHLGLTVGESRESQH